MGKVRVGEAAALGLRWRSRAERIQKLSGGHQRRGPGKPGSPGRQVYASWFILFRNPLLVCHQFELVRAAAPWLDRVSWDRPCGGANHFAASSFSRDSFLWVRSDSDD